jgi:hypothetical protein
MEKPEELLSRLARYVVTVLSLLPNTFGFSMKVASSALTGPNDAMAKSATSAMLAILIASSRIAAKSANSLRDHSSTKERMQHRPAW